MPALKSRARATPRGVALVVMAAWFWCLAVAAHATPFTPTDDATVVEQLPTLAAWSRDERRLRRELARQPRDSRLAIEAAQSLLQQARAQGDARYAGRAMGVLQAWQPMTAASPPPILVMHATVAQYLHDFDGAARSLNWALAANPRDAQGWLTLATIYRVQGDYAKSDAACRAVGQQGQPLYAAACLAENAGLRGDYDSARATLHNLLASRLLRDPRQAATRQWLWASVAEVEELAGRPAAAEAAYRQTRGAGESTYDALAYSDFLLHQQRPAEVLPLLAAEPGSDAVLLRRAIAEEQLAARQKSPPGKPGTLKEDVDELAARFEAAALRPGATRVHAREHALFALDVQHDPQRALTLARQNVQLQREPIDLLLFARAAAAADDAAAKREVAALMRKIGLEDARVKALL